MARRNHARALAFFSLLLAGMAVDAPAQAIVILDTYPADGVLWKPIEIAVPFVAAQNTEITDITAAIRGSNGTVELGIMTDASSLPSDSFLFSRTVTPTLGADVTLTDVDWTLLATGQYWLAAVESLDFSLGDGFWQGNGERDRSWAFKATPDGPWFPFQAMTPAARIEVVSEPPFPWLAAALVFAALAIRRARLTTS